MIIRPIFFLVLFFLFNLCFSQSGRDIAREGNQKYDSGLFSEAEVDYRKSLSQEKNIEEAQFNLSDALFKQERYDESINTLNNLIANTSNADLKADSYYNLGNNFLQQQKLQEAVDSYKNCLRLNPSDEEARYNLSKTLSILNQQPPEQNQNQEDNQEDSDNQEDQNSGETDSPEQDDEEKDSDSENQNNDQNQDGDSEQESKSSEEDLSGEDLSRQEMERILDALEREEQKVQEEMKKIKAKSKNKKVEKDW